MQEVRGSTLDREFFLFFGPFCYVSFLFFNFFLPIDWFQFIHTVASLQRY